MTATTQSNVQQLVNQIEAATRAVAEAVAACSDEEWRIVIGSEGRSVGVVFHHIAFAYPFVVDWALKLAAGEGLPAVSYDDVHAINHQHAESHAAVDQVTTLTTLNTNATAAKTQLSQLTDSDLQTKTPFDLIGGQEISVQQVIEWFLINHAQNHLSTINETLEAE